MKTYVDTAKVYSQAERILTVLCDLDVIDRHDVDAHYFFKHRLIQHINSNDRLEMFRSQYVTVNTLLAIGVRVFDVSNDGEIVKMNAEINFIGVSGLDPLLNGNPPGFYADLAEQLEQAIDEN